MILCMTICVLLMSLITLGAQQRWPFSVMVVLYAFQVVATCGVFIAARMEKKR